MFDIVNTSSFVVRIGVGILLIILDCFRGSFLKKKPSPPPLENMDIPLFYRCKYKTNVLFPPQDSYEFVQLYLCKLMKEVNHGSSRFKTLFCKSQIPEYLDLVSLK